MRPESIEIQSPSRLHFGLIDPWGISGRRFGGFGVGIRRPHTRLRFSPSSRFSVIPDGPFGEKISGVWKILRKKYRLKIPVRVEVLDAPYAHCGFGSGTQITLSAAVGLLRLNHVEASVKEIVSLTGRGRRSAIGLTVFQKGGFVLDGGIPSDAGGTGKGPDTKPIPLLISRYPFPEEWRFVIAVPKRFAGLSGGTEKEAFGRLGKGEISGVRSISCLLLFKLVPALLEKRIDRFGQALTEIQRIVGSQFKRVQHGRFGNPIGEKLVRAFLELGAAGAGQSSWGPAVYGLAEGNVAATELKKRIGRQFRTEELVVFATEADNRGFRFVS